MRFLLDEGMPVQLRDPLRLNKGHEFEHVSHLLWKGKGDEKLFADAAERGFDGIITLNVGQLTSRREWRALKVSGLHHVSVQQRGRTARGAKGTARVIASVIVAIPYIIEELENRSEQRIVSISLLAAGARHKSLTPTEVSRALDRS